MFPSRNLRSELPPSYKSEKEILTIFSTENHGQTCIHEGDESQTCTYEESLETFHKIGERWRKVESKCILISREETYTAQLSDTLFQHQRNLLNAQRDWFQALSWLEGFKKDDEPATERSRRRKGLKRLPDQYTMRKRVWSSATRSVDFMRKGLPGSLDSLLELLRAVYRTVTILYRVDPESGEGVPPVPRLFWIKILGHMAADYWRMLREEDTANRAKWLCISQYWYLKASKKSPTDGELYSQLAILAESDALQWLYYCSKAFCVPEPAFPAWKHIQDLFGQAKASDVSHPDSYEAALVRVHGILFCGENRNELQPSIDEFTDLLQRHLNEKNVSLESSCYMAISLICSLFGYGAADNPLRRRLPNSANAPPRHLSDTIDTATADRTFQAAMSFAVRTWKLFLGDASDDTNLPFFHITMSFLYYMAHYTEAMLLIMDRLPWAAIAAKLNKCKSAKHRSASPRRLPEDDAMGGLFLSSSGWSSDFDYENATEMSQEELEDEREWRVLRLGHKLAELGWQLRWDEAAGYKDIRETNSRAEPKTV